MSYCLEFDQTRRSRMIGGYIAISGYRCRLCRGCSATGVGLDHLRYDEIPNHSFEVDMGVVCRTAQPWLSSRCMADDLCRFSDLEGKAGVFHVWKAARGLSGRCWDSNWSSNCCRYEVDQK